MNNSALHFQSLLAQAITQMVAILGPDITYATLGQLKEIKLDQSGKIVAIEGVDEDIVAKLLTTFSSLTPEVTREHLAPLFASYKQTGSSATEAILDNVAHHSLSSYPSIQTNLAVIEHGSEERIYTELC